MTFQLKSLIPFLPIIAPIASHWVESRQQIILNQGQALNAAQLADALRAGVRQPDRIRLQLVASVPMPGHPLLTRFAERSGLLGSRTAGLTLGYGIYIRDDHRANRALWIHEFVHVAQYERLGSIHAFLKDYLRECLDPGYPLGPLEQEAIRQAGQIVREPPRTS